MMGGGITPFSMSQSLKINRFTYIRGSTQYYPFTMISFKIVLAVLLFIFPFDHALYTKRGESKPPPKGPIYGDPLFLTPYLMKGQLDMARAAAAVPPLKANVSSYAGFFTVDPKYNSNMFFWYFPAENNPETAPVAVWLQGGPGASSLGGLFEEIGPFYVKKQKGLKMRQYYWSQAVHMIYIDNPVGTGFSFTDNDDGYSTDEVSVGNNLYEVLRQFFTLFPELQKNDFFVTGESYAGKYIPALGYAIHTKNPTAQLKINLKGLSIGDGLCDPGNMMVYGDYLYQVGLIDSNMKTQFNAIENNIQTLIGQNKYEQAFEQFDILLNGDLIPYKSLFFNATGFSFYFNYLHNNDDSPFGDMNKYLDKDIVRRSIHVGNLTFHTDSKVEMKLKSDVMQSVAPWISVLLNNYDVLFYNGQLDIIVAYPLTVNFLKKLDWCGSANYTTAERKQWTVNGELAGYSKTVKGVSGCKGSLTEVLVRNAGHMVPQDQPLWALDLISRFTQNKPF